MEIVKDYTATRYYDDLLVDNDSLSFRLRETVTGNRIITRSFDYNIRLRESVLQSSGLYAVGAIQGSSGAFGLSGGIMYQQKNKRIYGLNIGYFHSPYLQVTYGVKLR